MNEEESKEKAAAAVLTEDNEMARGGWLVMIYRFQAPGLRDGGVV